MNSIAIRLLEMLNEKHIQYAVLRNYQSLPADLGGSDLDVWVEKEYVNKCTDMLNKVAEETGSSLVSFTDNEYCPKFCYLNKQCGIQIDLFIGSIRCKDCIMFDGDSIKRNIKEYNGIKVLDDRYADLMAFLKEVLNNGKCKEKYTNPLTEYKDVYIEEYLTNQLTLFSSLFCNMLANTIKSGDYTSNFADLCAIGRDCLGIKNSRFKLSNIKKLSRFLRPTGYTLAFLGTDGSGKSFIINSVTPILNEAFHNGIIYKHMRPNYLPSLAVATGKKKSSEEENTICTDPHASKPSGFVGSLVRLSYYWLDYTWGYFRKVFPDKSIKTHVWLFDRYYYDYYVDQRRARLNLPSWIVKFYGLFVPSPDLTICLGGDPEKIYARKPETSLEEVTRQTNVLKEFARTHKNTVWVDTTVAPDESIKAVMEAIVNMMSKRFAK